MKESKKKTVIVFSTYYNSPIGEEYLFSKTTTTSSRFTSQKLCDYFWSGIIKDTSLIRTIVENRSDYLDDDALEELKEEFEKTRKDREKSLKTFVDSRENELDVLCKKYGLIIDKENYDWVGNLIGQHTIETMGYTSPTKIETESDDEVWKDLNAYYNNWTKNDDDIYIELLEQKNGDWVCEHLKDNSSQQWFNTFVPQGMTLSTPPCQNQPWLFHRFSYYRFNQVGEVPNDVSVYAVWPLTIVNSNGASGKNDWVEALTDQFLMESDSEVEELYLILHEKDIEPGTTFKVYSDEKVQYKTGHDVQRYVALFQHRDKMGLFLSDKKMAVDDRTEKEKALEDIKQFVIKNVKEIYVYAKEVAKIVNLKQNVDVDKDFNINTGLTDDDNSRLQTISEFSEKLRKALKHER